MYYDNIPLPSQGLFYEGKPDYLDVYHITTEDELMIASLNLFNKGESINRLIDKCVCKPNNIKLNDLLVNDKEYIILYLKETAYGNMIESEDGKFKFDTHNIQIKNLQSFPDDGILYTYLYKDNEIKFKHLTIGDEKILQNKEKLDFYINYIYSINGNTDREYIKTFIEYQPINDIKLIKSYVDKINFGVIKKTFCLDNGKKVNFDVTINEKLFGLNLNNLNKFTKNIHETINFLVDSGEGFNWSDILKMPVHVREFYKDKLVSKLTSIKNEMNKNKIK